MAKKYEAVVIAQKAPTIINPIPTFTSIHDAFLRQRKTSLDPTRNSRIRFSSSKYRLGLKI